MSKAKTHSRRMEARLLIDMIARSAKRDMDRRMAATGVALTHLQAITLRLLQERPLTITEISHGINHDKNTLVDVVDALEHNGYVERTRDIRDRRRTPIRLTDAGRVLLKQIPAIDEDDAFANALSAMGEAREDQLIKLLRELAELVIPQQDVVDGVREKAKLLAGKER